MTFSLCMIVKNEEDTLKLCLDSVKEVFDEIIIVDTGSYDNTKKIAATYTDKIFDFEWCDDFSLARNFSFSKATGDFIMWLDADDFISDADRLRLIDLKKSLSFETDVVMMRYALTFDENDNPTFFYYRERLIKRMGKMLWSGAVHEVITPVGNVVYKDITIRHRPLKSKKENPTRNLDIYEKKLKNGAKLNARETYYYARELYYNNKKPFSAKYLEQFLDMPQGWYADKIGACIILFDIYRKDAPQRAKDFLLRALSYEKINPQVLCLLGDFEKEVKRTENAIFWYLSALVCPKDYAKQGFVLPEYERYYPLLQLCVCYDSLGQYYNAMECNRLAEIERPDSEQVRYNKEYFEKIMAKNEDNN